MNRLLVQKNISYYYATRSICICLSLDLFLNLLLDLLDGVDNSLRGGRGLVGSDTAELDETNETKEEVDSGKTTRRKRLVYSDQHP